MCGKPNPAEAEVCKYCQARLKPLNLGSTPAPGNKPEVPGWLTSLRGSGQDQPESASQSEPVLDWLTGLRSETSSEEGEEAGTDQPDFAGVAAGADRQVPDWLKGILPESETPATPEEPSTVEAEPNEESEQDWFSRINRAPNEPPPYEPVPLPDWLSGFDKLPSSPESPGMEMEAAQPPVEDIPSEPLPDEPAPLPDWLSGFDQPASVQGPAGVEKEAAQQPAEEVPTEASTPEWLAEKAQPPAPELPPLPEAPLQTTPPQVEAEFTFPEEAPEEPGQDFGDEEISFPDWLKGISQETNTPLVQDIGEQPPAVAQWPPASQAETPGTGQPQPETGQPAELPDWLAAAEQSLQAEGDETGFPDWLGKETYPSQAAPSYVGDETPSWMPPRTEPEDLQSEAPTSGSVAPFQFTGMESEAEMAAAASQPAETTAADLSWLDEMEANLTGMAPASDQAAAPAADFAAPASGGIPAASSGAYPPASPLPAWLTQAGAPEEPAPAEEVKEPDQAGLAPVELPSWLKSMQPTATMDAQAKEQAEKDQSEGAGPLAGLKGVLPAEPDIVQATKPPIYSLKLRVTDLQQTHANMLAELVQAEGDVKALPSAPLFTSQGLLRVLIAVVLIGAILLSMVMGVPRLIEPTLNLNPEVFTASQFIAGLPSGVPVLVVVDYSPGFSGDVSLILASIVDHLATKNETMALVSTVPTGPLQVESLVAQVKGRPGFSDPVNYANLGFIPGGPAGILAFIQDPSGTLPGSAWTAPALQNIHSLADFALLVVATENPETARMWIEQVRPIVPNIPIVMALSAQAEPLVRPYYNASPQQIQGLLGGYSAAVLYDTALGRRTNAATLWSPFATGLSVAVLLMMIGLLVNLLLGFLARSREKARSNEKA
jgi:hypothetical protein